MMEVLLPPLDGSIPTLPELADFHAKHHPTLPWLSFPSKRHPEEIVSISFAEMAAASHRVAHILRPGRAGPEREVVALLLETDTVLYVTTVLGLMRAGCIVRRATSSFQLI
jgi:acyl-CoA synthetase (AMP-forming)/AMP-acid ligase II